MNSSKDTWKDIKSVITITNINCTENSLSLCHDDNTITNPWKIVNINYSHRHLHEYLKH